MLNAAIACLAALATAFLMACSPDNATPSAPGVEEKTGRAEIRLPAIPKGFALRKASAAAEDSLDVAFILTLSGPGMVTRKQAWNLDDEGGSVTVTGIPVGERMFRGELEVNGHVTHEDSVLVFIEGGRTAQVNLRLSPNRGDAVVCVEIAGLPTPAACLPGSGPRDPIRVDGCYRLDVTGGSGAVSLPLRIDQRDSLLIGYFEGADGRDSAFGFIHGDGTIRFGGDLPGRWQLTGFYDTTFREFRGSDFFAPDLGVWGAFEGLPTDCPIGPRPDPTDGTYSCFDVSQFFTDGSQIKTSGTLTVQERGIQLVGVFRWTGHGVMPVSGLTTFGAGRTTWHLDGILPLSIQSNTGNPANAMQYLAVLTAGTGRRNLATGSIYWNPDRLGYAVGNWTSSPRACQEDDAMDIWSHHGDFRLIPRDFPLIPR